MDPPADPMPFEEAPLTWLAGFPFRTVHRFGPVSYLGAAEDAREGDEPLRAAVVIIDPSNEVTILFMALVAGLEPRDKANASILTERQLA